MFNRLRLAAALSLVASASAIAADLPARTAPYSPVAVLPAFTWTGFYVGANAGAGFDMNRGSFTDPTRGRVTASGGSGTAFIGGGQAGYNYQFTPGSGFVIGVETDFQGVGRSAKPAYTIGTASLYDVSRNLDWFGTVRGRIGYAFDRLLVYGTGGFAYGAGSLPSLAPTYPYALQDRTRTGYAAGAGVEYALTPNISAKIEGLYVDLDRGGSRTISYNATSAAYYGNVKRDDGFGLVRAGLNYRF